MEEFQATIKQALPWISLSPSVPREIIGVLEQSHSLLEPLAIRLLLSSASGLSSNYEFVIDP